MTGTATNVRETPVPKEPIVTLLFWVSVDDAMPPDEVRVLVSAVSGNEKEFHVGYRKKWHGKYRWFHNSCRHGDRREMWASVVAWSMLPEHPKTVLKST